MCLREKLRQSYQSRRLYDLIEIDESESRLRFYRVLLTLRILVKDRQPCGDMLNAKDDISLSYVRYRDRQRAMMLS